MSELVAITIDDIEYQVPAGVPLSEAARKYLGIEIPVFCAHPKLDPLGACRMCLVEMEGRGGRWSIVTACTTMVADGMKFRYTSESATQAREDTLEFLLVNHPLDCPICDKGGECPLQDQVMAHGSGESRFSEDKVHKQKRYPISDLILLDQERCILCWRCIRYLDEWEDKPQLGLYHRGSETVIEKFSNEPVDAKTSGNIIDLCPVGALTNRVSRFGYRPWELTSTDSICVHCSQGCNVRLDTRLHELRRIVARENMAVNDEWICDKGRFVHGFVDHPDRLKQPLVRDVEGRLQETTWQDALEVVADQLTAIVERQGGDAVGAIGSAKLSNEAAYLFQKFMRSLVGTNNVDHKGGSAVLADPRGLSNLRDVEDSDVIVLVGFDPAEELPVMDLFIRRTVVRKGAKLVVLHPRKIEDTRYPAAYLPYMPGAEVELLAEMSRALLQVSTIRERVAKAHGFDDLVAWLGNEPAGQEVSAVAQLIAGAERAIILYGPALVSGPGGENNRWALDNFARLAGCADRTYYIAPEANSVGVRDMGLLPHQHSGHTAVTDEATRDRLRRLWGGSLPPNEGLSYSGMLNAAGSGHLAALYLVGSDPVSEGPAGRSAIERAEFVVVQDMFLTETAALADVVLPAVSWAESDGTYTNLERRVQRAPRALQKPQSRALPDWRILTQLAQSWPGMVGDIADSGNRKGKKRRKEGLPPKRWTYASAQAVLDEISKAVSGYGDISWSELGDLGKQCNGGQSGGRSQRFVVPGTLGFRDAGSAATYRLASGNVLFDSGTLVQATEATYGIAAPLVVGINPVDSAREMLAGGEQVVVSSINGSLTLAVDLDERVRPGTLWISYSLLGAPVEALLGTDDSIGIPVQLSKAE
ncbi:MAG: NADH-quinone oxidoreductase subunit NuoG [Chloroflexota bacterium]|nr:NADH-quinone oxidoreductase subunit NuoG [Chloroflexota bacterium]